MTASTSKRSKTGRKKYRITTLMICEPLLSSFTISIASADKVQNLESEFIVREFKCKYRPFASVVSKVVDVVLKVVEVVDVDVVEVVVVVVVRVKAKRARNLDEK